MTEPAGTVAELDPAEELDELSLDELEGRRTVKLEAVPGDFHRNTKGTPYVADPSGELVKSGDRKGLPKLTPYSRPSGYGDVIENQTNLTKWGERKILEGLRRDPHLLTRVVNLAIEDPDDKGTKAELDALAELAKKAGKAFLAAERGTFVHELTEEHDRGAPWLTKLERADAELELAEPAAVALLRAWRATCEFYGLEILANEIRLVNDTIRAAGTTDRIVRLSRDLTFRHGRRKVLIPAGTVLILDIKTGKVDPKFSHGYAIQLAIYAGSVLYDPDTFTRTPMPWPVDQTWGLIAHLPVLDALAGAARCELILIDLAAGREAAELARQAKAWGKRTNLLAPCLEAPAAVTADGEILELAPGLVSAEAARADLIADVPPIGDESGGHGQVNLSCDKLDPVPITPADPFDGLTAPVERAAVMGPTRAPAADLAAELEAIGAADEAEKATPGDPTERARISAEIDRLRSNATALAALVAAIQAAGIPSLKAKADHNAWELRRLAELVRAVDQEHGTFDQTEADRAALAAHTAAALERRRNQARPDTAPVVPPRGPGDEGEDLTPADVEDLRQQLEALNAADPARFAWLMARAAEAHHGPYTWHVKSRPSERRWAISWAVMMVGLLAGDEFAARVKAAGSAAPCDPEEAPRAVLAHVVGDEWPIDPRIPLGVVFGALTIDEATHLAELAARVHDAPAGVFTTDRTGALVVRSTVAA